jgi:hypothetical protein
MAACAPPAVYDARSLARAQDGAGSWAEARAEAAGCAVEKASADIGGKTFVDVVPDALECYAHWAIAIDPSYGAAEGRDAALNRVESVVLKQDPDPRAALTLAAQISTSRSKVADERGDAAAAMRCVLRAAWFLERASSASVLAASDHFRKAAAAEREAWARQQAAEAAASRSAWAGAFSTVASAADVTGLASKANLAQQAAQVASVAGSIAQSEAAKAATNAGAAKGAETEARDHLRQARESGVDVRDALFALAPKVPDLVRPYTGKVTEAADLIATAKQASSVATVDAFSEKLGPFIGIVFELPPSGREPAAAATATPTARSESPHAEKGAPPAAPPDAANLDEKLRKLKSLLDKKLITPADYETRKNKLLDAEVGK